MRMDKQEFITFMRSPEGAGLKFYYQKRFAVKCKLQLFAAQNGFLLTNKCLNRLANLQLHKWQYSKADYINNIRTALNKHKPVTLN